MNGATDRGIISLCMYKGENWSTTDHQRIELRYMNTIASNFWFFLKYVCLKKSAEAIFVCYSNKISMLESNFNSLNTVCNSWSSKIL